MRSSERVVLTHDDQPVQPRTSRRRFLLGLGAMGIFAAPHRLPSALAAWPALSSVTRCGKALGAEVAITALHADREAAAKAVDAAFDELTTIERLMSIYLPSSQVSLLNRDGRLQNPHPCLVEVLRRSAAISEKSGGGFDITVQPLWELYASAKKQGRLPDQSAIESARAKVNWRKVEVGETLIRFGAPGMAVTLNAIAQGYAADRVIAALRKHGIEHALANTGEIATLGRRADQRPWIVGIQHPRHRDGFIATARLEGRCMATSGDYATAFSDDFLYNHIFDPSTGRSPRELAGVSIVADNCTDADALATAVFVMGHKKGLELVRSMRAEAFFVFKEGRILATEDFPNA